MDNDGSQGPAPTDLEPFVARFAALTPAAANAPDTRLSEYERERLPVVGRAEERAEGDAMKLTEGHDVNVMYIRVPPGNGFAQHKHSNWEMLLILSGKWEITTPNGGKVILDPWDVMIVPGGIYHDAKNISDEDSYLAGINPGNVQAQFFFHPDILKRVAEVDPVAAEATTSV
jgi:quercetin dioxygenase-like cupin family protein